MVAYYNENNPKKAAWLRELINEEVIAPGDVDERSIKEVKPEDVKGYTQCHWFAGIGVWSYALRLAGWDDSRPVWTGSCPCQSFSVAGSRKGMSDPRHLWPDWFKLIQECRPSVIFGEQVEAAIRKGWLDLVQDDLEAEDYTFGKIVLPACSIGAPMLRQRIWFMAYSTSFGLEKQVVQCGYCFNQLQEGLLPHPRPISNSRNNKSFYAKNSVYLPSIDGKLRPIKSGTFPLVDVTPVNLRQMCNLSIEEIDLNNTPEAKKMRLEGYGDAIVAELAAEFIATGMEYLSLI